MKALRLDEIAEGEVVEIREKVELKSELEDSANHLKSTEQLCAECMRKQA